MIFFCIIVITLPYLDHAACTSLRDCKRPSCRLSGCSCDGEPFSCLSGVCDLHVKFDHLVFRDTGGLGSKGACSLGAELGRLQSLQSLVLALEENSIDAFGAICLAKGIGQLTGLRRLEIDLDYNYIGTSGSYHIGEALGRLPKLTNLTLSMVGPIEDETPKLSVEGARGLFAGLKQSPKLEILNMELGNNGIGDQGIIEMGALFTSLTSLSSLTLDLFDNQIGTLGMQGLGAGLQNLVNLTCLHVNIIESPKTDAAAGIIALGSGIQTLTNLSQMHLGLQQLQLTDTVMQAFGTQLSALKGLRSLSLRLWDYSLTDLRFRDWLTNLQNIKNFSISFESSMILETFISDLGIALGKLPSLSFIDVEFLLNDGEFRLNDDQSVDDSRSKWDEHGVCELAKMVGRLTELHSLKVSMWGAGYVPNECLCALWKSIGRMLSLSALEVQVVDTHIGVSGSKCLATALTNLNWLTSLVLDLDTGSQLGNEGAKALGRSLGNMAKLTSLSLDLECGSDTNDLAAIGLAAGLRALTYLRHLKFYLDRYEASDVTYMGMHAIEAALGTLHNLKTLDINMLCDDGPSPPLQGLGKLRELTHLKWSGCLSIEGFGEQFRSLTHVTEMEFHGGTAIPKSTTAFQEFAVGLGAMTSIAVLTLELKNVGAAFAQSLGIALGHLRALRSLDLTFYEPQEGSNFGDIGAASLGAGIMNLQNLTQLKADFSACSLGIDGANGLGRGIAMLRALDVLDLDLSDNSIGEGFRFLGGQHSLMDLTHLSLDFDTNPIGDASIDGLAQGIRKLTNLFRVYISFEDTWISDAGVCSLAAVLENFTSLKICDGTPLLECTLRSNDTPAVGAHGVTCLKATLNGSVDIGLLHLSRPYDGCITTTLHGNAGPLVNHRNPLSKTQVKRNIAFCIFTLTVVVFCFLCYAWRRRCQRTAALEISSQKIADMEMDVVEDNDNMFIAMPSTPRGVR